MMAQSSEDHKTQVLHFSYNDEDISSLTVLINDVRFHIIVNPKDLQKSREKPLYYEYLEKICGLRDAEQREEEEAEKQQLVGKGGKKEDSEDKDSAIDVASDEASDDDQDSGSAAVELRNWILSAFGDVTSQCAPPDREPIESTLYEWYHGPTYFYSLQIKAGQLKPELLETTDELNTCIEKLVPKLKMPKYIQSIDLPWINANDLTVQSEVSLPEPAHPGKVTDKDGNEYFFKPVVPDEPGPIKREISILQKLANLDLDIKVPRLLGFVAFNNSKTEIMGFLLSNIDGPKPLTKLLKSSVPRAKRAEWSTKSEKYVKTLHENNIIWGDAKADNFIVDANDELWIIDFGGSYTEGWVDPELSETMEGDDMGLEKVVKALQDPDGNTYDPEETASGLFVTEKVEDGGEKRKRDDEEDEDEVSGGGASKRQKEDVGGDGSGDEYTED
jgi:serine/threonine protein kinase